MEPIEDIETVTNECTLPEWLMTWRSENEYACMKADEQIKELAEHTDSGILGVETSDEPAAPSKPNRKTLSCRDYTVQLRYQDATRTIKVQYREDVTGDMKVDAYHAAQMSVKKEIVNRAETQKAVQTIDKIIKLVTAAFSFASYSVTTTDSAPVNAELYGRLGLEENRLVYRATGADARDAVEKLYEELKGRNRESLKRVLKHSLTDEC
ncbi:hypothetical protein M011DRAFT_479725 [Sporormia fimetaria CBS 119925]|uniref:Uncharacterized protein n=1 Tax=Sporormia fimetaria CBS 119925 TaxID=1340428 RepID=A0A6A6V5V0_9PLEO|nr:hypothetical protein M011DRAFT_479725 [Sporormia fimetaria CBS 119925]